MKDILILLVLWLFVGSLRLNIMWIDMDKKTLGNFYFWKKRKTSSITNKNYLYGLIYGLILGPFCFKVNKDEE